MEITGAGKCPPAGVGDSCLGFMSKSFHRVQVYSAYDVALLNLQNSTVSISFHITNSIFILSGSSCFIHREKETSINNNWP
jgi:hypothetical protein